MQPSDRVTRATSKTHTINNTNTTSSTCNNNNTNTAACSSSYIHRRRTAREIATAYPSFQPYRTSMAMPTNEFNPQDPEAASSLLADCSSTTSIHSIHSSRNNRNGHNKNHHHTHTTTGDKSKSHKKKKKPSRALLFLRNRARGSTVGNVSVLVVGCVLLALSTHRVVSLIMSNRRWINAPITYMQRTCPAFDYTKLPADQDAGTICITTLTDQKSPSRFQRFIRWRNFDGILDLTWSNKEAYSQKHGYHLYDGSHWIDPSRPPAWSKIKAVKDLLDDSTGSNSGGESDRRHCDWVMWTDADTVIMNSNVAIRDFLPADETKDLLVASDKGGGYNSGVFLFRNTDWSRQFLDQWWSMTDFVRPPGLSLSGDNAAMKSLLGNMKDFDDHVLSPPRCTFNSFAKFLTLGQSMKIMDHLQDQTWYMDSGHYHKGDFIAHTPGVDNKGECLKLLLREAQ